MKKGLVFAWLKINLRKTKALQTLKYFAVLSRSKKCPLKTLNLKVEQDSLTLKGAKMNLESIDF